MSDNLIEALIEKIEEVIYDIMYICDFEFPKIEKKEILYDVLSIKSQVEELVDKLARIIDFVRSHFS